MDTLRPVEVSEYYISRIANGMCQYFWDNIFKEIFNILKSNSIDNAGEGDLIKALKTGKIWYENGYFRTENRFSNSIATVLEKLGAKYINKGYKIDINLLPRAYILAIETAKLNQSAIGDKLRQYLSNLNSFIAQINLSTYIDASVSLAFRKLQLDIIKSAQDKKVPVIELNIVQPTFKIPKAKTLEIEKYWEEQDKKANKLNKLILEAQKENKDTSELKLALKKLRQESFLASPSYDIKIDDIQLNKQTKKITEDYVYNLKYWVKKWEAKNIIKMRQDVADMIQKGARVPEIQKYFENRWKVATNKAKFLAVNESHLAGSVIKATSYQELGCNSFVWGRSSSKEKRILHEEYYGETFTFDNPPIIDEKLGIKGLPRQIWNCKCHMLIKPPELSALIDRTEEIRNAKRNIFTKLKYKINNNKQHSDSAWRYRRFGEG